MRLTLADVQYEQVLQPDGEGRYVLQTSEAVRVAPATGWRFQGAARAWIDQQWVGDYRWSSAVGPWIELAPGSYTLRWEKLTEPAGHVMWLLQSSDLPREGRLGIVGWACYARPLERLERLFLSAMKTGVHLYIWGWQEPYIAHTWRKIRGLRRRLPSLPPSIGYVLQIDFGDCLVLAPESEILDRLRGVGDLVMGCEDPCSPVRAPAWEQRFTQGPHRFPNTGCWGGARERVHAALDAIIAMREQYDRTGWPSWAGDPRPRNDQYLWHVALIEERVTAWLDTRWQFVAHLTRRHSVPDTSSCRVDAGRLITDEGHRPVIAHWPGPWKRNMHLWDVLVQPTTYDLYERSTP